jgi:hypothetical protein
MVHLLSMVLTAYDPRRNPAARLLRCCASQACESLVQLLQPADASAATAEDYTKKPENMHGQREFGRTYKVLSPSGKIVALRAARYA